MMDKAFDMMIDEAVRGGPDSETFRRLVQMVGKRGELLGFDTPIAAAREYVQRRIASHIDEWGPMLAPGRYADDETEAAIQRVQQHADPNWRNEAQEAVAHCARTMRHFTSDDVHDAMSQEFRTHEPRAMGAVMRWGVGQGLIRHSGRQVKTKRAQSHRSPRTVWESCALVQEARAG
jgi:hypothetical protein